MVETRRAGPRHKKSSPPILSHEFVIQNHGDIITCFVMLFLFGLMFPLTSSTAMLFVVPQYNETKTTTAETITGDKYPVEYKVYRNGIKDLFTLFFYTNAWIVVHAILQEYLFDNLSKKANLSKAKQYKFTESCHLLVFALYSICHAVYIIEDFLSTHVDIKKIWLGYPEEHKYMSEPMKLFFIFQIAYWLHQFPEFYFQKMKSDEIRHKAFASILYIGFIGAAYALNFTRLAVVLLFLEYISQAFFHSARLAYFYEKKNIAKPAFKLWNVVFILARLASCVLSVTTFWYGLRQSESAFIDVAAGNFNTSYVRINCLIVVIVLQLYMLWNFIMFHVNRYKESSSRKAKDKKPLVQAQPKKKRLEDSESDVSESTDKRLQQQNKKRN
ncbi:hypothetical protein WR25_04821 [Diploscapter pachys]|uniref:TLC domain-containing protein n=1 Tax=Diploscapter pachys TaxID=2018661 RepID=A0A2A2KWQ6_9BILA|nr:hypothetical protein WR25_04821 [Diploscapter pachys]